MSTIDAALLDPDAAPVENLLELRGIRAAYDGIDVLYGVDIVVPKGSVVALLGPNGAGKTTTLRVASGLHAPSAGDVMIAGRRVNGARPEELARCGFCLVPEGRGIFPNLSVRDVQGRTLYQGRFTGQVTPRNRVTFSQQNEYRCQGSSESLNGDACRSRGADWIAMGSTTCRLRRATDTSISRTYSRKGPGRRR